MIFCDTSAVAKIYVSERESIAVRQLHHNFAEIYTYDKHQTAAAAAVGLKPVAVQP